MNDETQPDDPQNLGGLGGDVDYALIGETKEGRLERKVIRNVLREVASNFDVEIMKGMLRRQAMIAMDKNKTARENTSAFRAVVDAIHKGVGDVGQEPQHHVVYTPQQIQRMSDAQLEEVYRKLMDTEQRS